MKMPLATLVALFLSQLTAVAANQSTPEPAKAHLQIDTATVLAPIADDFIGFGYETSAVTHEGFFSEKNQQMVQLYRTLSSSGLVRIGGIIGDHTRYEPDGQLVANATPQMTVINKAVLIDLGGFLRATGWKVLWTLNLGTGSKEGVVQEALAVQAALGDRLHSFEIGNEVDLLKRFDSSESYHAAYLDYKAAIRVALPTAVFSGPDSASHLKWTTAFAEAESKDMKLLLHHYNRTGARNAEATIEKLLATHPASDAMLQALGEAAAANHLTFRINEVNTFFGGGKPDVSDTFASALWCVDCMYKVAAHGGGGVNMETDVNQIGFISHYSPIFRKENGQLEARPEHYGMLALAMARRGSLLKVSISQTPVNLTAYASKAVAGPVWVTILNKDLVQAANVEITLPAGCTMIDVYRLAAPSVQRKTDVTLGGTQVASDGTWKPGDAETMKATGDAAVIAVPVTSAMLVPIR